MHNDLCHTLTFQTMAAFDTASFGHLSVGFPQILFVEAVIKPIENVV